MTKRKVSRRLAVAFALDDDGATAIEYGLIAALIAIAIIGSMTALSSTVSTTFSSVDFDIKETG